MTWGGRDFGSTDTARPGSVSVPDFGAGSAFGGGGGGVGSFARMNSSSEGELSIVCVGAGGSVGVPRLVRAVREARATSDTVVVFLHWGIELDGCPTSTQRTLARQLVSAGADIVVGGHAHRLQGAGRLGRALVSYGLPRTVRVGVTVERN